MHPDRSEIEVTGPLGASCSCGRWPPPWPDVSWASTRSTSPTSRAPRRPPAASSRGQVPTAEPAFTDGAVEVRTLGGDWLGDASTVDDAVTALLSHLGTDGYVAVMAYLDRLADASLAGVRAAWPSAPGGPPPSGGGRGSCTRPASSTRVAPPRASTSRSPARHDGPRGPGPRLHLRAVHRGPGGRRRPGAGRARPARAAAAPHRPRCRAGAGGVRPLRTPDSTEGTA